MTVKEVYLNGRIHELEKEKLSNYTKFMKALVYCMTVIMILQRKK